MLISIFVAFAAATLYLWTSGLDYVLDKIGLSRWNSSNKESLDFLRIVLLIVFAISMASIQVWLGAVSVLLYLAGRNRL